jgi:hypothetical protein
MGSLISSMQGDLVANVNPRINMNHTHVFYMFFHLDPFGGLLMLLALGFSIGLSSLPHYIPVPAPETAISAAASLSWSKNVFRAKGAS